MNSELNSPGSKQQSGAQPSSAVRRIVPSDGAAERSPNSRNTINPQEGNDLALAKAPTLMIDQSSGQVEEGDYQVPATRNLRYIQGIVQGQRAYIVTNLLEDESQILLQPQMVWTIGRNRDAALPLKDRMLSRHHAVLLYIDQVGFHLIDLNSMNGSFLNGVRIERRQLLKDGDCIRLGRMDFTFFISRSTRSLDPIHSEIMTRFHTSNSRSSEFIDYAALEEPELLFKTLQR
jgi:hypothetical protein